MKSAGRLTALLLLALLTAACMGRPGANPTPDASDEISDFVAEDRPAWKGTATVKLTGSFQLDLVFSFFDTNSPLRGPGLVELFFESDPYSLSLNGETGNPTSEAYPMALVLSNEEFATISGQAPQCVFTFPQPGPAAIAGDAKCTGLTNGFGDGSGTLDLLATFSIGPEG